MKNKLDPFAERLDEWKAEGKTLAQMQAALLDDGCRVALSSLSDYLSRRHQAALERELLEKISRGGAMNRELEAAYEKNGEPSIEQLIRVTKTLVMSLQVHGMAQPKLLSLANSMQQTVLNYLSGKTKAELEKQKLEQGERKLQLLEKKAAQADAAKGLLENKELNEEQRTLKMRELFGIG